MEKENYNPNLNCFQNPKISKYFYNNQPSPNKSSYCKKHARKLGLYFCQECFSYNICEGCLDQHQDHSVHQYSNSEETKESTRQTLLLEVEQTLNTLKGRENQLKNQVEEVTMIREKIKMQSHDIICSLKQQVNELEKKIQERLDGEFEKYKNDLQNFYREYDSVNNYLRQNLLQIIDGEIHFQSFGRHSICRDVNTKFMPNFGKVKQVMQKCKKYIKNVKSSMNSLENSIKYFSSEQEKNQVKFDKYDKFLREKTSTESDYNSPLLRTLNILQSSQSDLGRLKLKLRT